MRIANPDITSEEQLHQAGIALINLFAVDFFEALDKELCQLDGEAWLAEYRKNQIFYRNYNFTDPSNLLKELLRTSESPLRKPIRNQVAQKFWRGFYDRLQVILDDRNDWVHRNVTFTCESLKTLTLNIYPITSIFDLKVREECEYILRLLTAVDSDIEVLELTEEVLPGANLKLSSVAKLINSTSVDKMSIGELIDDKFTPHSYVLLVNGEIRDRKTREILSAFRSSSALDLGVFLLARKPGGGRLRISSEGILAAYFEDHWGYLATVNQDIWFPNHINFEILK